MPVSSRISLADYKPPSLDPAITTLQEKKLDVWEELTIMLQRDPHNYSGQQAALLTFQSMDAAMCKLEAPDASS